jgi:poly-gamma-glutamate synthesis protein (capsule biosynthesis protein)
MRTGDLFDSPTSALYSPWMAGRIGFGEMRSLIGLGLCLQIGVAITSCGAEQAESPAETEESPAEATPSVAISESQEFGSPETEREAPEAEGLGDALRSALIVGAGDILFHQRILRSLREERGGYDFVFRRIQDLIPEDAMAYANLETPLVRDVRDLDSTSPPILGADIAAAPALRRAGFDLLGLANNHAFDQAAVGLDRTLEALRGAGLIAVGAGESEDAAYGHRVLESPSGLRVAWLGFTRHVNAGPGVGGVSKVARIGDERRMLRAVAAARDEADVVVAALHWGSDFVRGPRPWQRELADRLVEGGVDLILGSGPHILYEVERRESARGDAVVAYSLGNFVSNQGLRYRVGGGRRPITVPATQDGRGRDGALLYVDFILEDERVQVRELSWEPLWTQNNFLEVHGRDELESAIFVAPLREANDVTQAERLPIASAAIGEGVARRQGAGDR